MPSGIPDLPRNPAASKLQPFTNEREDHHEHRTGSRDHHRTDRHHDRHVERTTHTEDAGRTTAILQARTAAAVRQDRRKTCRRCNVPPRSQHAGALADRRRTAPITLAVRCRGRSRDVVRPGPDPLLQLARQTVPAQPQPDSSPARQTVRSVAKSATAGTLGADSQPKMPHSKGRNGSKVPKEQTKNWRSLHCEPFARDGLAHLEDAKVVETTAKTA